MIYLENVTKSYGDKELFKIDKLEIKDGEKVGIVGKNGVGKTTFLDILSGKVSLDTGHVNVYGNIGYIKQINIDTENILSGGEIEKKEIIKVLKENTDILFADEPSSNLDIDSIKYLIKQLREYRGTLLVISHDRNLIDSVCNKIIEIENGKVTKYDGNYTKYKEIKEKERKFKEDEYFKYIKEKNRLQKAINESQSLSKSMKSTPTRMGNSEARLHKREAENKREKLEGHTKALESRLKKLEVKDKVIHEIPIYMRNFETTYIKSKFAVIGKNVNIKFENKMVLNNVSFNIPSNKITALIGRNGSGKTSLVKKILSRDKNIKINDSAKIGYFSQNLDILDNDKTVLENVLKSSQQSEIVVRNILGNLLIKGNDVYKNVNVLSGGEKVKVCIAKLLVSDCNLLILDEITNFLDVYSVEALEKLIKECKKTILLISHDIRLINSLAQYLLIIQKQKIIEFDGNYGQYLEFISRKNNINNSNDRLLLDIKLSQIISKLDSAKNEEEKINLEKEYKSLLEKKKSLN